MGRGPFACRTPPKRSSRTVWQDQASLRQIDLPDFGTAPEARYRSSRATGYYLSGEGL